MNLAIACGQKKLEGNCNGRNGLGTNDVSRRGDMRMSIISDAKEIVKLVRKLDDVELYRKILKLEEEIIEITRKNNDLQQKIDELKKIIETETSLEFRPPFYYRAGDDIPLCPKCWEVDKKIIHLVNVRTAFNPLRCQSCRSRYPLR